MKDGEKCFKRRVNICSGGSLWNFPISNTHHKKELVHQNRKELNQFLGFDVCKSGDCLLIN
jgi:hypothetical protein